MANAKEIESRIKSIKDTHKITSAMYMISSSKLSKAKKVLAGSEPYFKAIENEIARVLAVLPDFEHPYFEDYHKKTKKDEDKENIGYIVVTSDKGLSGAYNHNILKTVDELLKKDARHHLYIIGEVGKTYFSNRTGLDITLSKYSFHEPTLHRARSITDVILKWYDESNFDVVYLVFTQMLNSMTCEATALQLLPLSRKMFDKEVEYPSNIKFLPSANTVLNNIVPSYINGFLYGALVEAYCSEHNSRAIAMDAANRNADEMIRKLTIEYNSLRQAAITQEITEVVSGAKALKKGKAAQKGR